MFFVLQSFLLFSFVLLHAAVPEKCDISASNKWTSCRWDRKEYITREIRDWQRPGIPSCASISIAGLLQKAAQIFFKEPKQITTQAVLDCFGSCSITSPLLILSKLRTECRKKRDDWDLGIFLDLPEGVYPEYDGAAHECRINAAHKPYFAPICIEYKLYSEIFSEKLQSLDQLKALIEQGIVMAVLKVKRGFREYTLNLDHVYDSKKDRTVYETEMHSVLLLGYRSNGKHIHLLIQNPWRVRETVPWGENGYAWVA
uniref:Pept_C1 domain-containing protein n=1 Tax=Globodera pallida TaxID=36090 RepID=A0A183BKI9_GLOPA